MGDGWNNSDLVQSVRSGSIINKSVYSYVVM